MLMRLTNPIEIDGASIRAIQLRTPSTAGLNAIRAASDPIARRIAAVVACTGLPEAVIDELDTGDFTAISEVIADFFPKGTASPSGAPSSPKPPTG